MLINFKYIILFVVSKIRNETKSQIEKECINIFQKKIEIRNIISKNLFADNRSYILKTKPEDRSEYFGELNIYLSNFLKKLWENPEFIFEVLLNSSIDDIKDNLSDFFINNFYENVLSQNCIENNLLYIIALSLKEEINNLINKEKPESFLNKTYCGYMLEKLLEKNDIQFYFKTVISEVIEKLKNNYSNEIFVFDPKTIEENNKIYKSNFVKKNEEKQANKFNPDYLKPLKEENLKKYLSDYEGKETNKNKKEFKDFIQNINKTIESSKNLYGMKTFSNNIKQTKDNIIYYYEKKYCKISKLIDIIFTNLSSNINLLPYQIKCICKIISKLIEKKFPDISAVERNAFTAKFFFYKLFSKMILSPEYLTLIDDFIITENQEDNLSTLKAVIRQFSLGKLFQDNKKEGNYTPFNWMLIEKMPMLIEFFENINNVNLPEFIEKLIDDKLDNDYKYDYFQENKNEDMICNTFCINIDNFYSLIKNIEKNRENLFKDNKYKDLKLIVEKLLDKYNIKKLEGIKNYKEFVEEDIIPDRKSIRSNKSFIKRESINSIDININKNTEKLKLNFFLITNFIYNEKNKNSPKENNKKLYFNIPDIKKSKDGYEDIDITKRTINMVKNYLSAILYNYYMLNKDDFNKAKISNTLDILNELKKNMKSLKIVIDETIPSEWFIESLLEFLPKLPKELIKNDYEELYNQLENDLKNAIENLNYEDMSIYLNKYNYVKKGVIYYNNVLNLLKSIKLNSTINNIIQKCIIPVELKYKNYRKSLDIKPIQFNEVKINNDEQLKLSEYLHDSKKYKIHCLTINEFINYFPDLCTEMRNKKLDIFTILDNIKFPQEFDKYINLIIETISKRNIVKDESELNIIKSKLHDYIMEKIYDKIFPKEMDNNDSLIYLNSKKLNWVEPKHILKKKSDYLFGCFIPDVKKYYYLMEIQRCPSKKILYMEEIFKSISNLSKFNDNKIEGIDGELPILDYSLIKIMPQRIRSNCEYIKLFLGEKSDRIENNHLTQIVCIYNHFSTIKYSDFNNITEEEFNIKCKKNLLTKI